MNVLSLRMETQDQTAEQVVRHFFDYLGRREIRNARALTAKGFSWFGDQLSEDDWRGEKIGRFLRGQRVYAGKMRRLSIESARAMPAGAFRSCFGGLTAQDKVLFVDVTRGELTITVIVVTRQENKKQRVLRVLDPEPFASYMAVNKPQHQLAKAG